MARAQFEYDEVGNTFYYVLVSFYAIVLVPLTWIFFPIGKNDDKPVDESLCQCAGCAEKERQRRANQPWRRTKKMIKAVLIILAWIGFALIVRKITQIEQVHEEYDPYTILGLDQGAPTEAVKKAYRVLSKQYHPDRGGDAVTFDRIAKAYQALTDDESRENWEKYGNPDGPTAATYGIALPKWLVSSEYGSWVLALYGLVFIVLLPLGVGFWWYNSIKYSVDKVLLDTTQLFGHFILKTPKMEMHRMLRILGGSFEFWKHYNKDIIERETDDMELPRLMKELNNLGENKKENPLSLPYSLKARILIYAHLSRVPLNSNNLDQDQRYIIKKVPILIEEMVSLSQQLYFYGPPQKRPSVDTIENLIKLFPMTIQALWPKNSALLQLPHIDEGQLFHIRKNKIMTCSDLGKLEDTKRRQVLKSLGEAQYRDVLAVLKSMPRLSIQTALEVQGEDDRHEITAGCLVTLRVTLNRESLLPRGDGTDPLEEANRRVAEEEDSANEDFSDEDEGQKDDEEKKDEDEQNAEEAKAGPSKKKVWAKQPKKKQNKPKKGGKGQNQRRPAPVVAVKKATEEETKEEEEKEKEEKEKEDRSDGEGEDESVGDEEDATRGNQRSDADESDTEDWTPQRKINFEKTTRDTHRVHCPYFPGEKFEWWWLTLQNKQKQLVTAVTPCKTLVDSTQVEMRFEAPQNKGIYFYQLGVRSDSYMDADYTVDIKLDVKEAKKIELPVYDDSEDENEKVAESSSEYTEESDED